MPTNKDFTPLKSYTTLFALTSVPSKITSAADSSEIILPPLLPLIILYWSVTLWEASSTGFMNAPIHLSIRGTLNIVYFHPTGQLFPNGQFFFLHKLILSFAKFINWLWNAHRNDKLHKRFSTLCLFYYTTNRYAAIALLLFQYVVWGFAQLFPGNISSDLKPRNSDFVLHYRWCSVHLHGLNTSWISLPYFLRKLWIMFLTRLSQFPPHYQTSLCHYLKLPCLLNRLSFFCANEDEQKRIRNTEIE